ncbi:MAG TPA: ankyrin repeat domain-containing protein [Planctomycetaceae bacterium]|nr:ankyrin repeat domain-containing protein [Planctomycetaceae bacterium]
MLTGEVPQGIFDPPSKKVDVDVRLDEIVLRALAREPERRYQSASAVKIDVQKISSGSAEPIAPAGRFPSRPAARGFSTIMERQVSNLWHWVAATPETSTTQSTASLPVGLMLILCLTGIASVFFPWIKFYGSDLPDGVLTLNGMDNHSSSFAIGGFAMLAVVVAAIPSGKPIRVWQALLMILAASFVIFMFFGFNEMTWYHRVMNPDRGGAEYLHELRVTRSFQPAFYCSLGSGVILLILSAMSFRHVGRRSAYDTTSQRAALDRTHQDDAPSIAIPQLKTDKLRAIHDDEAMRDVWRDDARQTIEKLAGQQRIKPAPVVSESPTKAPGIALMLYGLMLALIGVSLLGNGIMMLYDGKGIESSSLGSALVTVACLLLPIGALVLRGGWHLVSREKYQAALLGSFLGQPVGIWGLLALGKPGVKESFRNWPVLASDATPRISRKAIAGAVWALLLIFVPMVVTTSTIVTSGPGEQAVTTHDKPVLFLNLILLIATLPTTILGWLALGDIRRSNGKITGRGLAFFDAVLFPTLVVNGGIVGLIFVICRNYFETSDLRVAAVSFFSISLCIILDTIALTRLWKKTASTAVQPTTEPSTESASWKYSNTTIGLLVAAVLVVILLFMFAGLPSSDIPNPPRRQDSLLTAAIQNDLDRVRVILANQGRVSEVHPEYDQPLWWASYHGNAQIVNELLTWGASADAPDENGITPLMVASYKGNDAVVSVLLQFGADPNRRSFPNETSVNIYVPGNRATPKLVWPAGQQTPLTLAAMGGQADVVRVLLEHNADPGLTNSDGKTAFQIAEEQNDRRIVTLLWQYVGGEAGIRPAGTSTLAPSP